MPTDRESAQGVQEKFEFYFLSLIFTILALTIQTAKFGRSGAEDVLELSGWVCLLIAGVVGLWKMEWDCDSHADGSLRRGRATASAPQASPG
jgi:NhaP-type Na+/H+ or K+/H+ antiporter